MYSLYVGGTQVNDVPLTYDDVKRLYDTYKEDGYDNLEVVEVCSTQE